MNSGINPNALRSSGSTHCRNVDGTDGSTPAFNLLAAATAFKLLAVSERRYTHAQIHAHALYPVCLYVRKCVCVLNNRPEKPTCFVHNRRRTTSSNPTKAPEQMKSMFLVSISTVSFRAFFLGDLSGTLTTVPSSICSPPPKKRRKSQVYSFYILLCPDRAAQNNKLKCAHRFPLLP